MKIQTTIPVKINGVTFNAIITGTYFPGWQGSMEEPPEPPDLDLVSVEIDGVFHSGDNLGHFTDEEIYEFEQALWAAKNAMDQNKDEEKPAFISTMTNNDRRALELVSEVKALESELTALSAAHAELQARHSSLIENASIAINSAVGNISRLQAVLSTMQVENEALRGMIKYAAEMLDTKNKGTVTAARALALKLSLENAIDR